ncbi:Hypothetical predicted protein [Mytilus galloprovincialis]|uniref:DUF5641 domain-containing protein n=1 Tax=Mytilus galloprovincialis TaxID=29158 RepID=A0A8B6F190_MYTGA|nr:Hypothetical predicted protein [Mytilus galloprovincialis]
MPNVAPFPRSRVSRSLPFQGTGLDYLGPVYVKDGTVMKKRWICLFTCFVTRAIHLEIVNDMTTEEFICAFRRFVSTRGTPSEVISDNASQFAVSLNERKQIDLKFGKIKSTVSPGIGSVVIIKEDLPRGMWKLGRIVKHIQSNDGQLRSVKVRLANGNIIGRPLNLLYPLEIDEVSNDDSNSRNLAIIPKELEMSKRPIRTAAEIAKKKIQKLNL